MAPFAVRARQIASRSVHADERVDPALSEVVVESPVTERSSITTVAIDAATIAAASITRVVDDAGDTIAWRIARETGTLASNAVILAINGRGVSVGGARELARAIQKHEAVRVTIDSRGLESDLSSGLAETPVADQLAADAADTPRVECRLDPEKFRSADAYRHAVYVQSLPENAETCIHQP
jgi:hypothetical protein